VAISLCCLRTLLAIRTFAAPEEDPGHGFDLSELQSKTTKAGQMLEDRMLARSLIEYGKRTRSPEAMLTAVRILRQNAVIPAIKNKDVDSEAQREKSELLQLLNQARKMRPEDRPLRELSDRLEESLSERSRGLADGPKQWRGIKIKPGRFYALDPGLEYNAQERAIVSVEAQERTALMGIVVTRPNQITKKQAVGEGSVNVHWNAGIHTSQWLVKIYNMGKTEIQVTITTN